MRRDEENPSIVPGRFRRQSHTGGTIVLGALLHDSSGAEERAMDAPQLRLERGARRPGVPVEQGSEIACVLAQEEAALEPYEGRLRGSRIGGYRRRRIRPVVMLGHLIRALLLLRYTRSRPTKAVIMPRHRTY